MAKRIGFKLLRRVICFLILLLLLTQMPFVMAMDTGRYKDCSINHPFYDSISEMEKLGVVKGTGSQTLAPDRKITKEEYITFLVRLFCPDAPKETSGPWYKVYENAVIEKGLFSQKELRAIGNTITWDEIYPSSMRAAGLYPYPSGSFSDMPVIYASEPALSCTYTLMDAGIISRDAVVNKTPTRGEVLDYLYRLSRSSYQGADTAAAFNLDSKSVGNQQSGYRNVTVLSEMQHRSGMTGRWIIPNLGVNVATFRSWEQYIVDQVDSAAMFTLGSMDTIADHDYQGFKSIIGCSVGTKAYFDYGNGRNEYVCTASFPGYNIKSTLTDNNYLDISNRNPRGITCYTCNGNSHNIWIVFFQPV